MRDLERNDACLRALPRSVSSDRAGFLGGGTKPTQRLPRSNGNCEGSGGRPRRVPAGMQFVCDVRTPLRSRGKRPNLAR